MYAGCVVGSFTSPVQPTAAAAPLNSHPASQLTHQPSSYSQLSSQHQQQLEHQQLQDSLAAKLMAAVKPILLDTTPQVSIMGCQLLAAVAAQAPAALLQQLIEQDCCEHLFEVLRGTLSSCSTRAQLATAAAEDERRGRRPGGSAAVGAPAAVAAAAAFEVDGEALQAAATTVLHYLASQGEQQTLSGNLLCLVEQFATLCVVVGFVPCWRE